MSMKTPVRSIIRVLLVLAAGLCPLAPTSAKSPRDTGLDLEMSLQSAALVIAVRVEDVSELQVIRGGKLSEALHQYTFEPIQVLKGVYSRPRLLMTSADLRGYGIHFDPKNIRPGERRLLLLGRSSVGYIAIHRGSTADLAFPRIDSRDDSLLRAAAALLANQGKQDRLEIVNRLAGELDDVGGRGAVVLLAALERRAYIAAQRIDTFRAVSRQLRSDSAMVRETAAHVLGTFLEAEYLGNRAVRDAAVADLAVAVERNPAPLAPRVAALRALGEAAEAVRRNDVALRLVEPGRPYDTLAELSARLDILGRVNEDSAAVPDDVLAKLVTELPFDAPQFLQQSVAGAWARSAAASGSDRLIERIRRKKLLGLDAVAEVEAFGLIFPKANNPWPLQRTLLSLDLTVRERQAFVEACEHAPVSRLVPHLENILDPRHVHLRRLAADLLIEIDTQSAAKAIRPRLAEETDLAYKLRLAAFIGHHGFDDGYPYAVEHMSDPRYLEAAVEAIGTIDKAGSAEQMLDVYSSSNDLRWQRAAVRALGLLGHQTFLDELRGLTDDLGQPLAAPALVARADMEDAAVIELLPAALSSRSTSLAVAAAKAAARLLRQQRAEYKRSESEVRTVLATLARDPQAVRTVRRQALEALVDAEDPQLDEVLVAMLRDARIEQTDLLVRVRELLRERKVRI